MIIKKNKKNKKKGQRPFEANYRFRKVCSMPSAEANSPDTLSLATVSCFTRAHPFMIFLFCIRIYTNLLRGFVLNSLV